ncbi:MAG: chitobiase/beta-hexosaminidase C-terminal domain-containing protein [Leptospiraceae bacterium]|nr:chitobiase/beta-hexosaminidase C-terminal domain-containing protein [Leptospiraceae bacterium]
MIIFFSYALILAFGLSCMPGLDRLGSDFATFNILFSLFNRPSLGGEVSGLLGRGLTLELESELNGSKEKESLEVNSNGSFRFNLVPSPSSRYSITILQQPSNPDQSCTIGGNQGTMGRTAINSILVQCQESLLPIPNFSPNPGEFSAPTAVIISSSVPLAKIFFTTNGSNPACNPDGTGVGTEYTTPIAIPQPSLPGLELRAIACLLQKSSSIQTGIYRITNGQLGMVTSTLATNPPSANYTTSPQNTMLSPPAAPPAGTTIHYTVDGTTPTCSSPSTPNPVTMLASTTIRAIACAPDWTASSLASFSYIITGTVDTPSFSIAGGTYNNEQTIGLSVVTPGAEIRYAITTDGSAPIANCSSTLYTSPILVNSTNTRIQAIGCLLAWMPSTPSPIQTYTLEVANPILSPAPPFAIQSSQIVSASSSTSSSIIHFTDDGSLPTCVSSTIPPTVIADASEVAVQIRAIACRANFDPSSVSSGNYILTGTLVAPSFTPASGTFTSTQNITLNNGSGNPVGTEIRYRTDGSPATCSDTVYSSPISVPISQTITAISCRNTPLWNPSSSTSSNYTITGTLATPTFTPTTGTYNDIQSVTIASNAGSTVYYNLATGSDPPNPTCGVGSTTQPVSVVQTDTRIRAIACLAGWNDSLIGTATFTLRADTPTPNFANATIFGNSATITFASSAGASLRVVEGSFFTPPADPTCADPIINSVTIAAFPSPALRSVKAIACRAGFVTSNLFSGSYTVNGPVTSPTLSASLDPANRVTASINAPPAMQALCYRIGADPECSTTLGGVANPLGQTCASGSTVYNSGARPIISVTSDFRIRACSNNHQQSNVVLQTFNITGTVGAVSASPAPSIVNNDPTITLSSLDSTIIYYRTDGTNPDCTGVGASTYSTPFLQAPTSLGAANIKAIGCAPGKTPSAVADLNYTYQVAIPDTVSTSGTKINDELVTITSITTGSTIRYRLDSLNPADCASGSLYTLPLDLPNLAASASLGLRAIACKANYLTSTALSRDFTFETGVPIVKNHITDTIIGGDIFTPPITVRFETNTIGGRLCLDTKPHPTTVNPICSGASCGAGMTDLGLNTGTYLYSGAVGITTAVRVCKANYNPNGSLSTRTFFPLGTVYYRAFVSDSTFDGNLGGPIGADDKCNADSNRPTPGVPYLAFLGSASPQRNLGVGNPFQPLTEYRRTDNTTSIQTSDALGNPQVSLLSSWNGTLAFTWTGFDPGFSISTNNCSNWTSNSNLVNGMRGTTNSATNSWHSNSFIQCNTANRLYCLESRHRIWVTNNTNNGNLGGLTGADAKCNDLTDLNHPKSGRYKAMLLLTPNRIPGGIDWVFKPNAAYYRSDRSTLIGLTDSLGRFIKSDFTVGINTSFSTVAGNFWSGGANSNFNTSAFNCNNFTNTIGSGSFGLSDSTVLFNYVTNGSTLCSNSNRLLCVEQ